ncbi:hypothetical protein DIPPA_13035 [Diplonema papillatum]|nr:hypothetical protein DIPPA_13035 [Diplonema papillatum]|eukprot:gene8603-13304_t
MIEAWEREVEDALVETNQTLADAALQLCASSAAAERAKLTRRERVKAKVCVDVGQQRMIIETAVPQNVLSGDSFREAVEAAFVQDAQRSMPEKAFPGIETAAYWSAEQSAWLDIRDGTLLPKVCQIFCTAAKRGGGPRAKPAGPPVLRGGVVENEPEAIPATLQAARASGALPAFPALQSAGPSSTAGSSQKSRAGSASWRAAGAAGPAAGNRRLSTASSNLSYSNNPNGHHNSNSNTNYNGNNYNYNYNGSCSYGNGNAAGGAEALEDPGQAKPVVFPASPPSRGGSSGDERGWSQPPDKARLPSFSPPLGPAHHRSAYPHPQNLPQQHAAAGNSPSPLLPPSRFPSGFQHSPPPQRHASSFSAALADGKGRGAPEPHERPSFHSFSPAPALDRDKPGPRASSRSSSDCTERDVRLEYYSTLLRQQNEYIHELEARLGASTFGSSPRVGFSTSPTVCDPMASIRSESRPQDPGLAQAAARHPRGGGLRNGGAAASAASQPHNDGGGFAGGDRGSSSPEGGGAGAGVLNGNGARHAPEARGGNVHQDSYSCRDGSVPAFDPETGELPLLHCRLRVPNAHGSASVPWIYKKRVLQLSPNSASVIVHCREKSAASLLRALETLPVVRFGRHPDERLPHAMRCLCFYASTHSNTHVFLANSGPVLDAWVQWASQHPAVQCVPCFTVLPTPCISYAPSDVEE